MAKCQKCGKVFDDKGKGHRMCWNCHTNGKEGFSRDNSPSSDLGGLSVIKNGFLLADGKTVDGENVFVHDSRIMANAICNRNTIGQLRKFYGKLKALEKMTEKTGFEQTKQHIYSLKRDAADASSKKTPIITREFKEYLIDGCVDWAVKDEGQFKGYVSFFESVVAYFPKQ